MTLEQRLKGDERVSWVILSGEREFQPEGTASAKILRYDHLECSRNSKDASVVGAEGGSNNRLRDINWADKGGRNGKKRE